MDLETGMEAVERRQFNSAVKYLSLDPRAKLLILVLINIAVFVSSGFWAEYLCVGMIAILLILMGARRQAVQGLIIYAVMMAVLRTCATLPGPFPAYIAMLLLGFRKIVPIAMFGSGIIATTKVGGLVCAMQKMRFPKSIVISFAVALRFFPTAREEFACIRDAMRLRGIGFGVRNLLTRPLTVMECVLVPMVLRSANIAEELSAAAVTRGIDSAGGRTSINELRICPADVLAVFAFALLATLAALPETLGLMGALPKIWG